MSRLIAKWPQYNNSLIGHDDGKILYKAIGLNLLLLYFFTGFMANFSELVAINNLILVCFCIYVTFKKHHRIRLFSPLILLYGTITIISIGNHLWWMSETGFIAGARTMPIVLLMMLACRLCTIPGLFERSTLVNTLPFALLVPLGAHIEGGRFYSDFLNEGMQGWVFSLAYAIGLCSFFEKRFNWKTLILLFVPLFFAFYAARRTLFVYFLVAPMILVIVGYLSNKIDTRKVLYSALLLIFTTAVLLPIMFNRQTDRFGDDFSLLNNISEFLSGDTTDRSSHERRAFIDIAFQSTSDHWLGYGNANFPYVVDSYGRIDVSRAGHPHSGLAESLITAGYPGMILYFIMIFYLVRIGYQSPLMMLCVFWLFLEVFTETNLNDRIMWPLMAIAEREIEISKLLGIRKKVDQ